MVSSSEVALIERAKSGDRPAFGKLYEPLAKPLASFLYRMIAVRQDAEDLAQDAALVALEGVEKIPEGISFRAWLFRLALREAMNYLGGAKQWSPEALMEAGRRATEEAGVRRKLQQLHKSRIRTTYDIREHVDFCFTFMGRTLPPHEEAALLLTEIYGLPVSEVAAILEISNEAVEFRRQHARRALIDCYESRCSLINKAGSCTQCASLHTVLYEDRRRTEQALFEIELEQRPTPAERASSFEQRLAIVRAIDPLHAAGTKFHGAFADLARQVNRY